MLSKSCQYAIKALMYICLKSEEDQNARLQDICKALDSPPAFTSKILQQLVLADFISSKKGANGGFRITAEKCQSITLKAIITVIDGKPLTQGCFLGLSECSDEKPCPVHHIYYCIKGDLNQKLMDLPLKHILNDPKITNVNLKV